MRDKVIFLVIGIIISVLFFIFKITLYDALYYSNGFSNDLGNLGCSHHHSYGMGRSGYLLLCHQLSEI